MLAAIVVWPNAAGMPASIEAREAISVAWFAAVAAPVGRGSDTAEIGSVLWSEAMTTGLDRAIVFWPGPTESVVSNSGAKSTIRPQRAGDNSPAQLN
jgi:hypothetical protein